MHVCQYVSMLIGSSSEYLIEYVCFFRCLTRWMHVARYYLMISYESRPSFHIISNAATVKVWWGHNKIGIAVDKKLTTAQLEAQYGDTVRALVLLNYISLF